MVKCATDDGHTEEAALARRDSGTGIVEGSGQITWLGAGNVGFMDIAWPASCDKLRGTTCVML